MRWCFWTRHASLDGNRLLLLRLKYFHSRFSLKLMISMGILEFVMQAGLTKPSAYDWLPAKKTDRLCPYISGAFHSQGISWAFLWVFYIPIKLIWVLTTWPWHPYDPGKSCELLSCSIEWFDIVPSGSKPSRTSGTFFPSDLASGSSCGCALFSSF